MIGVGPVSLKSMQFCANSTPTCLLPLQKKTKKTPKTQHILFGNNTFFHIGLAIILPDCLIMLMLAQQAII